MTTEAETKRRLAKMKPKACSQDLIDKEDL
jgi:hypothetical protein